MSSFPTITTTHGTRSGSYERGLVHTSLLYDPKRSLLKLRERVWTNLKVICASFRRVLRGKIDIIIMVSTGGRYAGGKGDEARRRASGEEDVRLCFPVKYLGEEAFYLE